MSRFQLALRVAVFLLVLGAANYAMALANARPEAPAPWVMTYAHIDGDSYVVAENLTLERCLHLVQDYADWGYSCSNQ